MGRFLSRGTRGTLKRGDPVLIPTQHLSGTVFETYKDNVEVRVVADGEEQRRHFTYDEIEKLKTLDEMTQNR
jgi:hypothetical protein